MRVRSALLRADRTPALPAFAEVESGLKASAQVTSIAWDEARHLRIDELALISSAKVKHQTQDALNVTQVYDVSGAALLHQALGGDRAHLLDLDVADDIQPGIAGPDRDPGRIRLVGPGDRAHRDQGVRVVASCADHQDRTIEPRFVPEGRAEIGVPDAASPG
jgi:hypothetical protein